MSKYPLQQVLVLIQMRSILLNLDHLGTLSMETQGRGTIWRNSDSGYDLGSGTLEGGDIWQEFVLNPATQTDDANDFSLFRKLLPAPEVLLPQPKLWREEITGCVLPPRLAGFSQP